MTDENEATSPIEGPTPPKTDKMAAARAAKVVQAKKKSDDRDAQIEEMRAQIAALQSLVISQGSQRFERQEATLDPIPEASEELHPGTYIQRGVDAAGSPIMSRVRWTKEWVIRTYQPVSWTPMRSMDVGPHGVMFRIEAGIENTLPKICKDLYDAVLRGEAEQFARTRPLSPSESYDLAARAAENKGKHWSRIYRAGYGLSVRQDDAEAPAPEGVTTPAPVETPAK